MSLRYLATLHFVDRSPRRQCQSAFRGLGQGDVARKLGEVGVATTQEFFVGHSPE
jgi:hypothetical protein